MGKNETFYTSKVLKGDNRFMQRQPATPMSANQGLALRKSHNVSAMGGFGAVSADMNVPKRNPRLGRSASDVHKPAIMSGDGNSALDNSRIVHNPASTNPNNSSF